MPTFIDNGQERELSDQEFVALFGPPPAASEPAPVILTPGDLWRRTTETEAEAIEAAMAGQSAKLRNLFQRASEYRSDDPLWPVLQGAAIGLFGEARAVELLAPST